LNFFLCFTIRHGVFSPIAVWGYNGGWSVFGGDLFEAETTCTREHSMGQIASDTVNNLAFYSLDPPRKTPLVQNPSPSIVFNSSKTYITFVM
jgi:hypothetical protein